MRRRDEALARAHYWAREIGKLGPLCAIDHTSLKWQKNDAADAEAIGEAA
jgi:hypothetical protein